jgi:hypothetical protein
VKSREKISRVEPHGRFAVTGGRGRVKIPQVQPNRFRVHPHVVAAGPDRALPECPPDEMQGPP